MCGLCPPATWGAYFPPQREVVRSTVVAQDSVFYVVPDNCHAGYQIMELIHEVSHQVSFLGPTRRSRVWIKLLFLEKPTDCVCSGYQWGHSNLIHHVVLCPFDKKLHSLFMAEVVVDPHVLEEFAIGDVIVHD